MKRRERRGPSTSGCTALRVLLALIFLEAYAMFSFAQTRIGSAASHHSVSGAGPSSAPVLSADGHTIAFQSAAGNLIDNDDLGTSVDIFVLVSNRTTLVSVNVTGQGGGNDDSGVPALSANGRWVAFESAASNLIPNDTNGFKDVFLRDLNRTIRAG